MLFFWVEFGKVKRDGLLTNHLKGHATDAISGLVQMLKNILKKSNLDLIFFPSIVFASPKDMEKLQRSVSPN